MISSRILFFGALSALWLNGCRRAAPPPQPEENVPAGVCTATPAPECQAKSAAARTAPSPEQSHANVAELVKLLGNDDPAVANNAIESLAKIGSSAVPALVEALRSDDPYVSDDAAEALIRIADRSCVPKLIEALREPQARGSARKVLLSLAHRADVARFAPLVNDPDPYVRQTAIDVLTRAGGADAVAALLRGFDHRDYKTRRQIAGALGTMHAREAVPALIERLADPVPVVADEAARSLREITGQNFGFDPYAPPDTRRKAIDAWRQWAQKHRTKK